MVIDRNCSNIQNNKPGRGFVRQLGCYGAGNEEEVDDQAENPTSVAFDTPWQARPWKYRPCPTCKQNR